MASANPRVTPREGTFTHWRRPSSVGVALGLLAFVLALAAFDIHSHDIWWHAATGQWILDQGEIPRVDPFSSTVGGEEWVDHEWLAQIGLAAVAALGVPALVGLRVLVACLIAAVLAWFLARRRVAPLPTAGLICLALVAARLRLQVKPELLTLVLITWLVALAFEGRWRFPHLAVGLFFLPWVNAHGGFLLGLVVLGCVALGGSIDRRLARSGAPERREVSLRWGLLAAAAAATLVNPYGLEIYSVLGRIAETITAAGLWNPEWRPPVPARQPWVFLIAGASVALIAWSWRRLRAETVLITAVLVAYALRFARGGSFLGLAFPLVVAVAAEGRGGRLRAWFGGETVRARRTEWLGATALLLSAVYLTTSPGLLRFGFGVDDRFEPVGAVEFLARERPPRELYNEIGDGGYLIWKLFPAYPVFLDGRMEIYPELLARWNEAQRDAESWNAFLGSHGVRTAVVRYPPPLRSAPAGARPRPTRALFDASRWALVYFDRHNMVYLRRGEASEEIIERLEYRCLHPELMAELSEMAQSNPDLASCLAAEAERRVAEETD